LGNWVGGKHTACPLESGLISRNARTLSDSKSLREGMSPVWFRVSVLPIEVEMGEEGTFDDLAENASCGGHDCVMLCRIEENRGVGQRFEVMWGELEVIAG
jgi:hypothetical protein